MPLISYADYCFFADYMLAAFADIIFDAGFHFHFGFAFDYAFRHICFIDAIYADAYWLRFDFHMLILIFISLSCFSLYISFLFHAAADKIDAAFFAIHADAIGYYADIYFSYFSADAAAIRWYAIDWFFFD